MKNKACFFLEAQKKNVVIKYSPHIENHDTSLLKCY